MTFKTACWLMVGDDVWVKSRQEFARVIRGDVDHEARVVTVTVRHGDGISVLKHTEIA